MPARLPDIFVDRPVTIFGRHPAKSGDLRMRVHGVDAAGRPWQQEVSGAATTGELLTSLWGRARVRELEDRYASRLGAATEQLSQQIVAVSLETHVLSRFTAYVAVDRSQVVNAGGKPREILQPVELPAGWGELDEFDGCANSVICLDQEAAPAPGIRPRKAFRAGLTRGLAAFPSGLRSAASRPASLEEALEGLATATAAFKSPGWFFTRRRCFQTLVDSLAALETVMRSESHPRLADVSQLVAEGRQILADRSSLRRESVDEFVKRTEALLLELRPLPEPARAEFWK